MLNLNISKGVSVGCFQIQRTGLAVLAVVVMGHALTAVADEPVSAPVAAAPVVSANVETSGPQASVAGPIRDCIQRDAEGRFMGWLDDQHCMLSGRTTSAAQWFDGLFGGWYGPDDARMRLRVVTYQKWDENLGFHTGAAFRAIAVLPNARKRIRLVVSDEEDLLHSAVEAVNSDPRTSAAIRWIPDLASRVKYSFDIGVHSTPDLYARVRAQRLWRLSDSSLVRFTETLRYGVKEEGRALTGLDLERALDDNSVFKVASVLQYRQIEPESTGMRWGQDWVLLHRLGSQKALSYGFTFDGVQQPDWSISTRGVFVLYRQSFWRPWVYYEIEPHLTWSRNTRWDRTPSMTLRLEAQFGY